jgi:transcriptional regulator GlxA family with amidase domain
MHPSPRTVGIVIFENVEVLDFAGPFEVFSVARPVDVHDDAQRLFRPVTLGRTPDVIRAVGGLQVKPDHTLADHPPLDIVVMPGGWGTRALRRQPDVLAWLKAQSAGAEIVASVCTGALVLAEAQLLDGLTATTYWDNVAMLRAEYPQVTVRDDVRFVDNGQIVTSAGVSAGIDMSLHLVARLHGDDVAAWTARRMEYSHWP